MWLSMFEFAIYIIFALRLYQKRYVWENTWETVDSYTRIHEREIREWISSVFSDLTHSKQILISDYCVTCI